MSENPYTPVAIGALPAKSQSPGRYDSVSLTTWPIALGLNVILPVLAGNGVTNVEGKLGMAVAVGLCLFSGWVLCCYRPMAARKLVLGSMLLSATQLMPFLQIFAGLLGFSVFGFPVISSEGPITLGFAGALGVSLVVAFLLLPIAAGIGWLVALILPRDWFQSGTAQAPLGISGSTK